MPEMKNSSCARDNNSEGPLSVFETSYSALATNGTPFMFEISAKLQSSYRLGLKGVLQLVFVTRCDNNENIPP